LRNWFRALLYLGLFWAVSMLIATLLQSGSIDFSEKIVVIPLKGPISSSADSKFMSVASSDAIVQEMKVAMEDSAVKGIILDINSGGGEVVASKRIADAVKKAEKPVVALVGGVAASGAYWVASASDAIVADPLSATGSIGVLASYLDFEDLMEDYGVNYNRLVSGKYKDVGSPFRELKKDEEKMLQTKLDKIHDYFISAVAENRNLSKSDVKAVADGFFMLGSEAKDAGLVDYLGDMDLALNITRNISAAPNAKLYFVKEKKGLVDALSRLGMSSFYYLGLGVGDSIVKSRVYEGLRIDA
jgi:protease-4